jgi:hypothetical protein
VEYDWWLLSMIVYLGCRESILGLKKEKQAFFRTQFHVLAYDK